MKIDDFMKMDSDWCYTNIQINSTVMLENDVDHVLHTLLIFTSFTQITPLFL